MKEQQQPFFPDSLRLICHRRNTRSGLLKVTAPARRDLLRRRRASPVQAVTVNPGTFATLTASLQR